MDNDKKITLLIVKLLRMTQSGELQWDSSETHIRLGGTEEVLNKVYYTTINEKRFRIFKYRARYYTDEETFHWIESHRLEVTDQFGEPEWTLPEESAIGDLYESVRYQASNIDIFLDEFLDEEDLKDDNDKIVW